MAEQIWEVIVDEAREKLNRTLPHALYHLELPFYHIKIGRKTVFAKYSGVVRLYVIADDGTIWSNKYCCHLDQILKKPIYEELTILVETAINNEMTPAAEKIGIYYNGKAFSHDTLQIG